MSKQAKSEEILVQPESIFGAGPRTENDPNDHQPGPAKPHYSHDQLLVGYTIQTDLSPSLAELHKPRQESKKKSTKKKSNED